MFIFLKMCCFCFLWISDFRNIIQFNSFWNICLNFTFYFYFWLSHVPRRKRNNFLSFLAHPSTKAHWAFGITVEVTIVAPSETQSECLSWWSVGQVGGIWVLKIFTSGSNLGQKLGSPCQRNEKTLLLLIPIFLKLDYL